MTAGDRTVRRTWRVRLVDGRDVTVRGSEVEVARALTPAAEDYDYALVTKHGMVINPRHVVTAEPVA